jgi:glycosyltransferase involved in cell wall biosynthesis
MNTSIRKIKTALVPMGIEDDGQDALALAKVISDEVFLVGIVPITKYDSLSAGAAAARQLRKRLLALSDQTTHYRSRVIVSETPWADLNTVITQESPDIVVLEWKGDEGQCGIPLQSALSSSLCNLAIVRGPTPANLNRAMVAVRGGPHAELAFRISIGLHLPQVDVLHLALTGTVNDAPFIGMKKILNQMPDINLHTTTTTDVARSIFEESKNYDLVIMGVTADRTRDISSIGPVADKLLRQSPATMVVVKDSRTIPEAKFDESVGVTAISILVDKWFAENTFHADEFIDMRQLMKYKEKQGLSISLALPALNEEETIGNIITTIRKALMEDVPLLDEIIVIDSNSTDRTQEIAKELGIPVFIHQNILPELGERKGKGEALWKSLLVTKGDIIAWIDTDIINIHPRFVYGIIGPLLLEENIQFVKGFYRRPIKVGDKTQAGGGGRVTELTARPLINLFFPELSGVIQPLSGEYAGRRKALEQATFFSGYGVEIGLLIDIFECYGLRAIAQVDLLERIHKNQGLEALSKMSFEIIQTVLRKLETRYERAIIENVNKTMKLIRYTNNEGYFLEVEEVAELERPPIVSLSSYLERNNR